MIRFRCHRCKRNIAAPDGHVGRKVKCPGCMIVTIVPDIPGAEQAKARALARPQRTPPQVPPPGPADPLDELAAAVGGDIETAYDDDGSGFPGDEAVDDRAETSASRRSRRRPRAASGVNPVAIISIVLMVIVIIIAVVVIATRR